MPSTIDDLPDATRAYRGYRASIAGEYRPPNWNSFADVVDRGRLSDEHGSVRWRKGKRHPPIARGL
jgi:hypothetical protein